MTDSQAIKQIRKIMHEWACSPKVSPEESLEAILAILSQTIIK